ncbi:50S ribosomal protein L10 [archaeon]|jgi:large subunit ribosomal protein L10|nr:50S ribosomal protein L10 [archaeon]
MKSRPVAEIPEFKKKAVEQLTKLIKSHKTILLASIKDLPASQYQEIGKKLRGKAVVKVPKKNFIFKAIEDSKNKELLKIKDLIKNSTAFLFSDIDSYDLAAELLKSKSPSKAKPGQIAPEDITIEAGPTDLPPGPAISELGSVGLQVQITNGKIEIKESRVIVQAGKAISQNAADVMSKLDIKPFSIGYTPVAAFDVETGKLYLDIKIDAEETKKDLIEAFGRALPFAVSIGYYGSETTPLMVQKAVAYEKKLIRVITGEPEEVAPVEEAVPAEVETKKEEKTEAPKDFAAGFF